MDTATIISLIAVIFTGLMFLRDYILPAKINIDVGDSLQIVRTDRNKIQINFNLTNPRNKLSVINRLEAVLITPSGNKYEYEWNIFYTLEVNLARANQIPISIAVLPKSSVPKGIEFISSERFKWVEGDYDFKIVGWSNTRMNKSSNIERTVSFSLRNEHIEFLNLPFEKSDLRDLIAVKITN